MKQFFDMSTKIDTSALAGKYIVVLTTIPMAGMVIDAILKVREATLSSSNSSLTITGVTGVTWYDTSSQAYIVNDKCAEINVLSNDTLRNLSRKMWRTKSIHCIVCDTAQDVVDIRNRELMRDSKRKEAMAQIENEYGFGAARNLDIL